jgi:hypothetical protein
VVDALPPFSGDKPICPKCRHAGASTKWKDAYRLGDAVLKDECLTRSCDRCGFSWPEALNTED